uniref:AT-rich interactive domain-containing protein 3 n=2 Tax=Aquila chrysaetos chrysaetos TaxID=223781 RepID=A0A663DYZ8_AQUCH
MGEEGLSSAEAVRAGAGSLLLRKPPAPQHYRGEPQRLPGGQERLPSGLGHAQPPPPAPDHGDWTYEEQFKQLYELDGDPRRKEFLDDLFSFMQKRGTPVNRIPIMAKQVLDLYMLYTLVTEKGGLVEVINKKLWREITKGLNLPTSITSAAFTLRTQYMKYLYPYECEKRGLSNPNELQAAIDSNRREGRRQGFGSSLFTYSPGGTHGLLSSPKLPVPALGLASATNGGSIAPVQKIKKEEDSPIPISMPSRLPVSLAGHPVVAAQAAAVQVAAAAQAAALEQLREKLESGEPPEKKMALVTDEQQRLMQRALQQNLLAMTAQLPMSIRINSQGTRSPENRQDSAAGLSSNGTNSISMSVEINGIVYTGVLFAQTPGPSSLLFLLLLAPLLCLQQRQRRRQRQPEQRHWWRQRGGERRWRRRRWQCPPRGPGQPGRAPQLYLQQCFALMPPAPSPSPEPAAAAGGGGAELTPPALARQPSGRGGPGSHRGLTGVSPGSGRALPLFSCCWVFLCEAEKL